MDKPPFLGDSLSTKGSDGAKQAREIPSDTRSPISPTSSRRTNTTSDGSTATTSSTAPETAAQMAPTADTPSPDVLPQLTEPSDAESARYYEWLPSRPVLLGRSSSGVRHWGPDTAVYRAGGYAGDEGKPTKSMWVGPVGDHPLRSVWSEQKFRHKLKHALATLGGIDFHSITPARVGLQSVPRLTRPVTLLIGVSSERADGLTWTTIAHALRLTHDFLQSQGLGDIECELRKTEDVLAVDGGGADADADAVNGPFVLPSRNLHRLRQGSNEAAMDRIVSTCIGNSISPKGHLTQEGTLCLFLGPADGTGTVDEPVWALTCHHVAFPKEEDDEKEENDEKDKPPSIVMPANTGLRDAIDSAENLITNLQLLVNGHYGPVNPADPAVIVDQQKLEWARGMRDKLVALEGSDNDRVIGRVAYSPDIGVNDQPGQPKYTRDYALVRLDRRKFPDGFDFQNVVDLGPQDSPITKTVNAALDNAVFHPPDYCLMRLSDTIPLAEIRGGKLGHDFLTSKKDDDARLVLVKNGRTTGLTAGIALDLETYRRTYVGGIEVDSMEWTVVHISLIRYNGSRPLENVFSAEGDSGAAVFDLAGRVGGMLTSGTGLYRLDTTYVTPMAYLLEDIERELGFPVQIL